MIIEPRKFFKPQEKGGRDRLDFESVLRHSPDLANRVIIVRSRVRDLRKKFQLDCDWALKNFNIVTSVTIALAVAGVFIGPFVFAEAGSAVIASAAFGTFAGIAGAASKAFGWHKRYHSMFRARWALASLEVQIDDVLYNLAADLEEGEALSEKERAFLRESVDNWLGQLDVALKAFGESYGAALSAAELKIKK